MKTCLLRLSKALTLYFFQFLGNFLWWWIAWSILAFVLQIICNTKGGSKVASILLAAKLARRNKNNHVVVRFSILPLLVKWFAWFLDDTYFIPKRLKAVFEALSAEIKETI